MAGDGLPNITTKSHAGDANRKANQSVVPKGGGAPLQGDAGYNNNANRSSMSPRGDAAGLRRQSLNQGMGF